MKAKAKIAAALAGLCLIIAAGSVQSQAPQANPATPYLQNGDRFFEQGKYREALAEYQKALSMDPKNAYAQFQVQQIQNKTGMAAGEDQYELLPARDYSKVTFELGPVYKDVINNFSIRPPKGWGVDNSDPNFTVKLTEPYSEAYILVKVIPTRNPMLINYEFRDSMETMMKRMLEQVPASALRYCNFERFREDTVLRTEIIFKTGPNKSLIETRYISDINRVLIVSWVCQENLFYTWRPVVESSIATLNLAPR